MINGFENIDLWGKKASDYVLEKPKVIRFGKSTSKYNKICEKSAEKIASIPQSLSSKWIFLNGFGNINLLSDYFLEKPKDQRRIKFAKKTEKNESKVE